jgi:hypothetical protein
MVPPFQDLADYKEELETERLKKADELNREQNMELVTSGDIVDHFTPIRLKKMVE